MDQIYVQCPMAGTFIPADECMSCRYNVRGIHCPVHGRTVPEELCRACLKEKAGRPCSMAGVNAHLIELDEVPDQVMLCGFPRKVQAIKLTGPHPLHKYKKE